MRLREFVVKDDEMAVKKVFKLGVLALKEKALPLWFMIIMFYRIRENEEVIDLIYKDGVKQPGEVANVLKPKYLEWLSLTKGINRVRKAYNLMAAMEPYCKELHVVMSRIESAEMEWNFEAWVMPYQLACRQFGENDIDVWINYLDFYRVYNRGKNVEEKIQEICKDAEKTLNPLLLADFKAKFEEILDS